MDASSKSNRIIGLCATAIGLLIVAISFINFAWLTQSQLFDPFVGYLEGYISVGSVALYAIGFIMILSALDFEKKDDYEQSDSFQAKLYRYGEKIARGYMGFHCATLINLQTNWLERSSPQCILTYAGMIVFYSSVYTVVPLKTWQKMRAHLFIWLVSILIIVLFSR